MTVYLQENNTNKKIKNEVGLGLALVRNYMGHILVDSHGLLNP